MKGEFLRVFRAFSDERRLRVLELLLDGEQCACVLLEDMDITQPTLSHHMKILCKSGIVKSRRVGKWNYYSIDTEGCTYARRLLMALEERNRDPMLRLVHGVHSIRRLLESLVRVNSQRDIRQAEDACCCGL